MDSRSSRTWRSERGSCSSCKTTDWRAGCGRPACPVRREGEPGPLGPSYPYLQRYCNTKSAASDSYHTAEMKTRGPKSREPEARSREPTFVLFIVCIVCVHCTVCALCSDCIVCPECNIIFFLTDSCSGIILLLYGHGADHEAQPTGKPVNHPSIVAWPSWPWIFTGETPVPPAEGGRVRCL